MQVATPFFTDFQEQPLVTTVPLIPARAQPMLSHHCKAVAMPSSAVQLLQPGVVLPANVAFHKQVVGVEEGLPPSPPLIPVLLPGQAPVGEGSDWHVVRSVICSHVGHDAQPWPVPDGQLVQLSKAGPLSGPWPFGSLQGALYQQAGWR